MLVPCFYLGKRHQTTAAYLEILEKSQDREITELIVNKDKDNSPKISVQKLVMTPKVWVPYFIDPQLPWRALHTFKTLLGMIQDNLKYLFEFIEEWLNVACAHDVKRYEYVVKSKWKNPHADWRVLE